MAPPVWLITGASSGLGYYLTLHALKAGHCVIAGIRNPARSAEAVASIEAKGGKILQLDVTESDKISERVQTAEGIYGRIDVLVNNAGYSVLGAVEDLTEEECTHQFRTNFFGPLSLIRATIPFMRARQTGTIVNISSIAGLDGLPSCGLYASSKFALEGLSESLARELEPMNISVLIVEPGAFRTNFLDAAMKNETGLSEAYSGGPVDTMLGRFDQYRGVQPGDPEKAVERIFGVVSGEGVGGDLKGRVLRLPLGKDCVARVEAKLSSLKADLEASREVAMETGFE